VQVATTDLLEYSIAVIYELLFLKCRHRLIQDACASFWAYGVSWLSENKKVQKTKETRKQKEPEKKGGMAAKKGLTGASLRQFNSVI